MAADFTPVPPTTSSPALEPSPSTFPALTRRAVWRDPRRLDPLPARRTLDYTCNPISEVARDITGRVRVFGLIEELSG